MEMRCGFPPILYYIFSTIYSAKFSVLCFTTNYYLKTHKMTNFVCYEAI